GHLADCFVLLVLDQAADHDRLVVLDDNAGLGGALGGGSISRISTDCYGVLDRRDFLVDVQPDVVTLADLRGDLQVDADVLAVYGRRGKSGRNGGSPPEWYVLA